MTIETSIETQMNEKRKGGAEISASWQSLLIAREGRPKRELG